MTSETSVDIRTLAIVAAWRHTHPRKNNILDYAKLYIAFTDESPEDAVDNSATVWNDMDRDGLTKLIDYKNGP